MKRLLLILPFSASLMFCSTPKTTESTANSGSNRLMVPDNIYRPQGNVADTVTVDGTEYIPLLGRSENGVWPNLEGTWILQTMNGIKIATTSNIDTGFLNKRVTPGTEFNRDSVTTTEVVDGVSRSTTTINFDRMGNPIKRITPPQGSTYHIPQQPSISFFGSNETFSGFTGCNKFSGRYSVKKPDLIDLRNASSSTKMVCIGEYDEDAYLNTLHQVSTFISLNGQLQMMQGDKVVLVFTKKISP